MQHDGCGETGRLEVIVQARWQLRASGRHGKTLPFVWRLLGNMKLYWERREGEGGGAVKDIRTKKSRTFWSNIIGGALSSTWKPPARLRLLITASGTVGQSKTSGAGATGQEESGAASQALVEARQRRASSEGSLLSMVAGIVNIERSHRGSNGREKHKCTGIGDGVMAGSFDRGELGWIRRRDLEGRG